MLLMSPLGAAPQWCSVAVDVGQCFVYDLCEPLPYYFPHTGAISSVCYVGATFSLRTGLLCSPCVVWVQRVATDVCDEAAGESEVLLREASGGRRRKRERKRGREGGRGGRLGVEWGVRGRWWYFPVYFPAFRQLARVQRWCNCPLYRLFMVRENKCSSPVTDIIYQAPPPPPSSPPPPS